MHNGAAAERAQQPGDLDRLWMIGQPGVPE
jgi:hypothetical protein